MPEKPGISPETALVRLMEICSRAEKSPYEIEKKLKEWGLEKQTGYILSKLSEEKFINSERFAASFIHDKIKFNKWGKNKIRYLLRSHHIDPSIIEDSLSSVLSKEYELMIRDELEKKLKSIRSANTYQIKSKLYAFGNQRGYEPELINRYFDSKGF